jgi:hypothetical protein
MHRIVALLTGRAIPVFVAVITAATGAAHFLGAW